ncbi:hypothetical protein IRP63_16345 [Clostridium phage CWou-2020a]|uniref:Uncharacterized protein n=2 Tax=Clostridium botulinum TaxID=1491 RepID=A0A0A0IIQ2_CLOBO|nr:hypothetical protein [Clostridium botulinum]QPW59436.1 hypothetical protein IRP63_16345 [Clostridium phage CWou-2020a]KGN00843.1 hypothetical protein Z955_02490 [Clostridium botulinum C/D str. DC5]KOC54174.1 hypothetical protein ADU90_12595 [Clostridium botulinum]KOC56518.1 hypothetical protein ADU89_02605 [Clostridium botulinum]MCD3240897.1 hypothetical protein [Clostridium botulinum D/C]
METTAYDKCGRMNYNPEIHLNNGKVWNEEDINYLINWYDIVGVEEMSFALGRTEKTIMHKVHLLRKEGRMKKPEKVTRCKRKLKVNTEK